MRRTSITVALLVSVQFPAYAAAQSQTKSAAGGFGIAAPMALKHEDSTIASGLLVHELSADAGPRSFSVGWIDLPAEAFADGDTRLLDMFLPDSGAVGSLRPSLGVRSGKQVVHEVEDDGVLKRRIGRGFVVNHRLYLMTYVAPASLDDSVGHAFVQSFYLLSEQDKPNPFDAFSTLSARVDHFSFYESAQSTPVGTPSFGSAFSAAGTRRISYDLVLRFAPVNRHIQFPVSCTYFFPDDTFRGADGNIVIEPHATTARLTNGFGWDTPGHWAPGTYRVSCSTRETGDSDGVIIASGEFEIR